MYCVIQEIERKTEDLGRPKELEVYSWNKGDKKFYSYRYSSERFIRPIKKAYKISIHKSYREDRKVKKKQYSIITMGYYDIYEFPLEDCVYSGKIKDLAAELGVTEEYVYNLIHKKLDPLYEQIKEEYEQTEEYKTSRKHSEIIRKYNEAKRKFEGKYGYNTYDQSYDVFGKLREPITLKVIKIEYEAEQKFKRSYYSNSYSNHNYNNSSSYQVNSKSNYNDEDKKILKKMYKKLAMEFHPDRNNNSEESQRAMQIINNLKEEWKV